MRAIGKIVLLSTYLLPLFLFGCASTHYVEVYVADFGGNCDCTADMGQDKIQNVFAFPGDVIVWVNATTKDMTLTPRTTGLFEDASYTIASGERAMTPVLGDARGNFPIDLACSSGGVAGPTVVVGDPP